MDPVVDAHDRMCPAVASTSTLGGHGHTCDASMNWSCHHGSADGNPYDDVFRSGLQSTPCEDQHMAGALDEAEMVTRFWNTCGNSIKLSYHAFAINAQFMQLYDHESLLFERKVLCTFL